MTKFDLFYHCCYHDQWELYLRENGTPEDVAFVEKTCFITNKCHVCGGSIPFSDFDFEIIEGKWTPTHTQCKGCIKG